ncbi:MAG: YlbF family regulator, partial [Staphylococcus borealis]|nr:YlbF family regulator [Staphylococcus borealis]
SKEVSLQNLIDEVVSKIALSVSQNVKIEAGNPVFKTGHVGCETGGTCNCSLK